MYSDINTRLNSFSSYRVVNTLRLGYKSWSLNFEELKFGYFLQNPRKWRKNIYTVSKKIEVLMFVEKVGKETVSIVMSVLPFALIEELGFQQTAVRENWCMECYWTTENVLQFTRTCKYVTVCLWISHGKIKLSGKRWGKERKEAFRTEHFFSPLKSCRYKIMRKITQQPERLQIIKENNAAYRRFDLHAGWFRQACRHGIMILMLTALDRMKISIALCLVYLWGCSTYRGSSI